MSLTLSAPLPSDEPAERILLGMCMAEPESLTNRAIAKMLNMDNDEEAEAQAVDPIACISGLVEPQHFYGVFNREAYESVLSLWEQGRDVNPVTVNHEIQRRWDEPAYRGEHHPRPLETLSDMISLYAFSPSKAERWADDVRAAYDKRVLIERLSQGIDEAMSATPGSANEIASGLAEDLLHGDDESPTASLGEILNDEGLYGEIVEKMEDPTAIHGIRTGWRMLDMALGGLEKQRVYTVLADTSAGKSWFIHWLAWMVAKLGHHPLIISTEMGKKEVASRLVYMQAGLDWYEIKQAKSATPEQQLRVNYALEETARIPVRVREGAKMEISAVAQEIRRQQMQHKIDVVFIDHIQHLRVRGIPDHQETARISEVTASMKSIAQQLNIPIVLVSHIGRQAAAAGKPGLHSGKSSSSIEQDSDVVMSLTPVCFDPTEGWQLFPSDEAVDDYRNKYNRIPVEIRIHKSRSGGRPSEVRFLDWSSGGKFIEQAR